MCEYRADLYLVSALFTPHRGESLQFPPEKTLARAGVPSGTTDGSPLAIISSHTMLRERKEPTGRETGNLSLSDQLNEIHEPLVNPHYYKSPCRFMRVEGQRLFRCSSALNFLIRYPSRDGGARKADAASIWSVAPSMLWLPHVWAVSWAAHVPDGTAF